MSLQFAKRERIVSHGNGTIIRDVDNVPYGEFARFKGLTGIYEITCKTTNKSYIGSTRGLDGRISKHFSELRLNRHTNAEMQKDFNLYGFEDFEYTSIKVFDNDIETTILLEAETDYLKSKELINLYNEKITGIYLSDNLRGSYKNVNKDDHKTLEYRELMSKILSKNGVAKFDIYGKFIEEFGRINDILEKYPDYKAQPIRGVCNGSKKSYKGYIWKYIIKE